MNPTHANIKETTEALELKLAPFNSAVADNIIASCTSMNNLRYTTYVIKLIALGLSQTQNLEHFFSWFLVQFLHLSKYLRLK